MATNFPGSVDNLTNPTASDKTNSPSHAAQHANANDAIEAIETFALATLPHTAFVPAVVRPTASTNGRTFSVDTASTLGGYAYGTTITQNNYVEWKILLAAGTYTLDTLYLKNSDAGIATIAVNGSNLGTTIDGYAASIAKNQISTITGLTITAGFNTIRYTAATKNASASTYTWYYHGFSLTRTGA